MPCYRPWLPLNTTKQCNLLLERAPAVHRFILEVFDSNPVLVGADDASESLAGLQAVTVQM